MIIIMIMIMIIIKIVIIPDSKNASDNTILTGRLITISSCTNYCDLPGGNDAAIGSPNHSKRLAEHRRKTRPDVLAQRT